MLIPGQNSLGLPAGSRYSPLIYVVSEGSKLHFQDRSYGEEQEGSLFYYFSSSARGLCVELRRQLKVGGKECKSFHEYIQELFFFFLTKMCILKHGQFNPAELLTAENVCLVLTVYGLRMLKMQFYSFKYPYSWTWMEGKCQNGGRLAGLLIHWFSFSQIQ